MADSALKNLQSVAQVSRFLCTRTKRPNKRRSVNVKTCRH